MGRIGRREHIRCGVRHDQFAAGGVDRPSDDILHATGTARLREEVLLAHHREGLRRVHGWPSVVVHDGGGATGDAPQSVAGGWRIWSDNVHIVEMGGIDPRHVVRRGIGHEQSADGCVHWPNGEELHTGSATSLHDDLLLADHGQWRRRSYGWSGVVIHDDCRATRVTEWSVASDRGNWRDDIHLVDLGTVARREHIRCGVRHDQFAAGGVGGSSGDILQATSGALLRDDVLLADHREGLRRFHGWPRMVVHDHRGATTTSTTGGARWPVAGERGGECRAIDRVDMGAIGRREHVRCGIRHEQPAQRCLDGSVDDDVHAGCGTRRRDDILLADHGEGDWRIHRRTGVVVHDGCGARPATGIAKWPVTGQWCGGCRAIDRVDMGGIGRCGHVRCRV